MLIVPAGVKVHVALDRLTDEAKSPLRRRIIEDMTIRQVRAEGPT